MEITTNEKNGSTVTSEIIKQSVSYNECTQCSSSKSYEIIVKFKVQADCHNCPGCPTPLTPTIKLISTTPTEAPTTPEPTKATIIRPHPTPPLLGPSCDGQPNGNYSIAKLIPLFVICKNEVKTYEASHRLQVTFKFY